MFSLEQQKLPKTYSTTYSHGAKHILRHGDNSIFKHRLSLEIDSRPQSNDTATW